MKRKYRERWSKGACSRLSDVQFRPLEHLTLPQDACRNREIIVCRFKSHNSVSSDTCEVVLSMVK